MSPDIQKVKLIRRIEENIAIALGKPAAAKFFRELRINDVSGVKYDDVIWPDRVKKVIKDCIKEFSVVSEQEAHIFVEKAMRNRFLIT